MLQATVRWGKEPGVVLKPHRFRNGKFKASEFKGGRSEWAASEEDLKGLFKKGMVDSDEQSRQRLPPGTEPNNPCLCARLVNPKS